MCFCCGSFAAQKTELLEPANSSFVMMRQEEGSKGEQEGGPNWTRRKKDLSAQIAKKGHEAEEAKSNEFEYVYVYIPFSRRHGDGLEGGDHGFVSAGLFISLELPTSINLESNPIQKRGPLEVRLKGVE